MPIQEPAEARGAFITMVCLAVPVPAINVSSEPTNATLVIVLVLPKTMAVCLKADVLVCVAEFAKGLNINTFHQL